MKKFAFPLVLILLIGGFLGLAIFGKDNKPSTNKPAVQSSQKLQETEAPWQPLTNGLSERVSALKFPPVGNESFHQHSLLQIIVNGKSVTVPMNIGLGSIESPMHTHDDRGVIHMEAAREYPFTLGQFFEVWGVKFTKDQLGGYKNNSERSVQVFVNGKLVNDPVNYQLKEEDKIVVGYGKDGEVPADNNGELPKNL